MRRFLLATAVILPWTAHAGIVTDGTVGQALSLAGPNYAIPASLGTQAGSNLFHSFSTFSIATGESASFSGPNGISNIIARVTGGALSTIDGLLQSTIPQANLYLINPSGIVFGPNASLDIGGSFYASTANYVRLAGGGRFDATNPANDILITAPVSAFGFLGAAAPISISGALTVPQGASIGLVAGNIDMTGASLLANGGQIAVAAIASGGEVLDTASGFDSSGISRLGIVSLSGSRLDVGEAANANSGSGSIYIRGGQISLSAGSSVLSNTVNGTGGSISLTATGEVQADNSLIQAQTAGSGNAGLISIAAAGLTLTNAGQIDSGTQTGSSGKGGAILVTATDSVAISGSDAVKGPSGMFAQANASGSGGSIAIQTANLALSQGGSLDVGAFSSGSGGTMTLNVTNSISLSSGGTIYLDSQGIGQGGSITISGPALNLDGGSINATSNGSGDGGWIRAAIGNITITNNGVIEAKANGSGWGGSIDIKADTLSISNGALISTTSTGSGNGGTINVNASALTVDGGSINSAVYSSGAGGSIAVTAGNLSLLNGGQINSSSFSVSTGNLGIIQIAATDIISISGTDSNNNSSGIYGRVKGTGAGGVIDIKAKTLNLDHGGLITASAYSSGIGGAIMIDASNLASIKNGGKIAANSNGTGDAGLISLKSPEINIDGGIVKSLVNGSGTGGYIIVDAGKLTLLNGGQIDSSSSGGSSGNLGIITVTAPDSVDISGMDANNNFSGIFGQTLGSGNGGVIDIKTGNLSIARSGTIDAGAFSSGNGGTLSITATNSISLSSGATLYSDTLADGIGGNIILTSPILNLDGGNIIASSSGLGYGGYIEANVGKLTLTNGARIDASTSGPGWGGDINIAAMNSVSLAGGSTITSQSTGAGFAGSIAIDAGLSFDSSNSSITTGATLADGGNISLIAKNMINLNHSSITATVGTGLGNGGNIFLDPLFVVMNAGTITANAFGGNGGNINLVANNFLQSANSSITASSKLGVSGTVTLNGQLADLSGSLAALPIAYLDTTGLLRARCAAHMAEKSSSFVLAGRGGTPLAPDAPMPSSAALTASGNAASFAGSNELAALSGCQENVQ